ncbi:GTP-binding protein Obg/CgtA [Neoconidiobolus thromboides FSU 785]|nr:GTP-binding protein Obg/CgtA [Neoconidiobolus thromboides FSU 785]
MIYLRKQLIRNCLKFNKQFYSSKYIIGNDIYNNDFNDNNNEVVSKGGSFVDYKLIKVMGGNGGDGTVSFHRDKITSFGPPDGGNGGEGGSVYFKVDKNESTLASLKYRCRAKDGVNGKGKGMHGQAGEDLFITVPLGTIVKEVDPPKSANVSENSLFKGSDLTSEYINQVMELDDDMAKYYKVYPAAKQDTFDFPVPRQIKENQKEKVKLDLDLREEGNYIIANGGKGGYGNPHFSTRDRKSAMIAERGLEGEVKYLELELKTIADCGLVGMPNAGKSTFLAAVSNAHPKIAPYPFTTLNPHLGTIDYSDFTQVTIADIPGIIPGAHINKGLGHTFLRHIERSKILIYIIDVSQKDPLNDLNILINELEQYKQGLSKKASIVIANKSDLSNSNILTHFKNSLPNNMQMIPISAKYKKNIIKATNLIKSLVNSNKNKEIDC